MGKIFRLALGAVLLLAVGQVSAANPELAPQLKGSFQQGGMVLGTTEPGARVKLNDRELRVSAEGFFVFGFDRDAQSGDRLTVTARDGRHFEQLLSVQPREYQKQYIEGISKKIMAPDADDLKRIRAENRLVGKARKKDIDRESFAQHFQWPALGPITGVFGSQRVYNGEPRRPHYGVDVAGPVGTPVKAPAAGVVTLAHNNMFFSGGTLIVDHGHGISSSFLHLSEILVQEGDEVEQGQAIAKIGATGRVTGAHLDWRMNWFERRIDPQLLVPAMPARTE